MSEAGASRQSARHIPRSPNAPDPNNVPLPNNYAAIEAAEAELADPEASEFWTAVNYSVINRLMPERATER